MDAPRTDDGRATTDGGENHDGHAHGERAEDPGSDADGDGHGHDHDHGDGHGHDHDHDHDHDHGDGHGHDHDHGHGHHAHDVESLGVAVVTVSSSRSLEEDPAGDAIAAAVEDAGHEVVLRDLIADDYDGIQSTAKNVAGRTDVDVIVTSGGTGVTPDDVTVEALRPLMEKELPGFGELFRRLSYDEIGTKVVATRAVAGVVDEVPVFALPGSENAVRLGTEEIILPEAGHLAGLASRGSDGEDDGDNAGEDDGHAHGEVDDRSDA